MPCPTASPTQGLSPQTPRTLSAPEPRAPRAREARRRPGRRRVARLNGARLGRLGMDRPLASARRRATFERAIVMSRHLSCRLLSDLHCTTAGGTAVLLREASGPGRLPGQSGVCSVAADSRRQAGHCYYCHVCVHDGHVRESF